MEVENIKKIFQLNPILGDAMNNQHYRLSSKTTIPLLFTFQKKMTNLSKKKDANKADAILIASFFHNTYQKND